MVLCKQILFKVRILLKSDCYAVLLLSCLIGCFYGNNMVFADDSRFTIEIIAGGKRFTSFEQYEQSKRKLNLRRNEEIFLNSSSPRLFMTSLNFFTPNIFRINKFVRCLSNQEKCYQFKNKGFGFKEDAVLGRYELYFPAFLAMSTVGFNTGVMRMIKAFQNRGKKVAIYKSINPKDLADVLNESFPDEGYSGPILVMSDKNKLRIMTLDFTKEDVLDYGQQN